MRRGFGFHDRHSPFRFNPETLFAGSNTPGAWYDPSDLTTLFQDPAGTVPVTAVGQSVGVMLDKSQSFARGSNLVTNGDFSGGLTGWGAGANITATAVSGQLRLTGAGSLDGTLNNWFYQSIAGQNFNIRRVEITFDATWVSGGDFYVGSGYTSPNSYTTITAASNAGVKTTYVRTISNVLGGTEFVNFGAAAGAVWLIDNVSVREVAGAHAAQLAGGSRPVLQQTNGLYNLTFDGSDDGMFTSNVDFSVTDKITMWAGVTKLSDATTAIICELTANGFSTAGGCYIGGADGDGQPEYTFTSQGTYYIPTGYAAPITNVLSVVFDRAGATRQTEIVPRINGVLAQTSGNGSGAATGNMANAPLFIGRRDNASAPFNGRVFGLIVLGAAASDWQIAAAERWMAQRTGISII